MLNNKVTLLALAGIFTFKPDNSIAVLFLPLVFLSLVVRIIQPNPASQSLDSERRNSTEVSL